VKLEFIKDEQLTFLREGSYILDNETPQQRFGEIVAKVREYEHLYQDGLGDLIEYMIDENILSLSTPVIANFGRKDSKALPASCYIVTNGNSIADIYYSLGSVAMASKLGGGVGSDFQLVAQKDTFVEEGFFTNSKLDWIEDQVSAGQKVSQGAKRRGYNTPFISIMDNDFDELMRRVDKKNTDKNDPLVNNTVGIILPKGFRDLLETDKEAKRRYLKVLKARMETGNVYLLDTDNCMKNNSPVYAKLGFDTWTTNICSEFIQPTFPQYTSICVISALNATKWDMITPEMIKAAFMFLDIVNEEYIRLSEGVPFLEKANRSAKEKRDIGLGLLGLAELFQMKGFAYGDLGSRRLNKEIFSTIRYFGEQYAYEIGLKLGSPKICQDAGMVRRNASLMMTAPNKSTSFLSGVTSGGREPFMSNLFIKSLAKIQHVFKNKHLEKLLESKGKNTIEVWQSIQDNNGSVQHLDFLSKDEKDVFRTFAEISPKDLIDLAADAQEYVDMGQSLNLIKRKNYTLQDIYDIHKYGWERGIKTFYYLYSSAHAAIETDGEKWNECVSCAD